MNTSALVAIAGLLLYGLASGKASEAGRIAFFAGLLALLLQAQRVVSLW